MTSGWKFPIPSQISPYYARREGLAVVDGCIMFKDRIIIPACFQKRILRQLHRGHPGIDKMKTVARCHVYWPGIDEDITSFVHQCHACASAAKSPVKTTLESWPTTTAPMDRIHIDIAGPCDGTYYFVIVDSYSKWLEVLQVSNITSSMMITKLSELFSRYGDCKQLVSDNGTQFISAEFQSFIKSRGIQHLRTAPFHPQSNGQAERFVDTLKRSLKKLKQEGTNQQNLETFLQTYRSTPNRNVTNFKSPAEAFLGRKIRTSLDLLKRKENPPTTRNDKQNSQYNKHHGAKERHYTAGDSVYAKIYRNNKEYWVPGTIIERKGTVNYNVLIDDGNKTKLIRSHTNQMKNRYSSSIKENSTNLFLETMDMFKVNKQPNLLQDVPHIVNEDSDPDVTADFEDAIEGSTSETSEFLGFPSRSHTPERRQVTSSGRTVHAPSWMKDYDTS